MAHGGLFLNLIICTTTLLYAYADEYHEELFIKPLPPAHLYTYFQFLTLVDSEYSCKLSVFCKT